MVGGVGGEGLEEVEHLEGGDVKPMAKGGEVATAATALAVEMQASESVVEVDIKLLHGGERFGMGEIVREPLAGGLFEGCGRGSLGEAPMEHGVDAPGVVPEAAVEAGAFGCGALPGGE